MDLASQLDWLETIKKSKLEDLGVDKLLFIKVTPGTEKEWLAVFESYPYVRSVSLNWYGRLISKAGE